MSSPPLPYSSLVPCRSLLPTLSPLPPRHPGVLPVSVTVVGVSPGVWDWGFLWNHLGDPSFTGLVTGNPRKKLFVEVLSWVYLSTVPLLDRLLWGWWSGVSHYCFSLLRYVSTFSHPSRGDLVHVSSVGHPFSENLCLFNWFLFNRGLSFSET